MYCPYCAENIPDDTKSCPKCGTQMGSPLPDSPAFRQPLPPDFEPPTSGKAIGSLISGLFFFFLPASIVAIILGHLSLSEIRKSAGRLKGQSIATAGLILGYIGIAAIPFLLIIAAIAIPNLLRAKMAANESSAVASLRTYSTALITYAAMCPQQGFPASTEQLGPGSRDCNHAGLVTSAMASPRALKSGYVFEYHPGPASESRQIVTYVISADPVSPNASGTRHFYTDESAVIRFESNSPAGQQSQPLQ
jgi:type IV pilus assembly protein PilA